MSYTKDYDAWLFTDPSEPSQSDHIIEQAIERLMDEHNLDWDDAEAYFKDLTIAAEEEQAALRAEDPR